MRGSCCFRNGHIRLIANDGNYALIISTLLDGVAIRAIVAHK